MTKLSQLLFFSIYNLRQKCFGMMSLITDHTILKAEGFLNCSEATDD